MPAREPCLEVEVVTDLTAARGLIEPWRELATARGNAFVTPEWFESWSRHYGEAGEPRVCAAYADGELRGVMPLVLDRTSRPITYRFAGSALGDMFHPASRVKDEVGVASAVAVELGRRDVRRRPIVLENVEARARWWVELAGARGGSPITGRESVLPRADLTELDWEAYLSTRSRNLRSQVRRKLRALEREHEVRVRWTAGEEEVGTDISKLFELHDARWSTASGRSSLRSPAARAFHADFAAAAQRRGWLRLGFLELDGDPVAAWYGWRIGGRFAYYQAGFDPGWAARSVGFVLFAQTIRRALSEGAAEYDMLLGNEDFKSRFADDQRQVCTVVCARPWSAAGSIARAESRLRSAVSALPPGVRGSLKRLGRGVPDRLPMGRRR